MKDITILLTIYNRREFTLRWIKFIENFKCPFKIFICDGGNDKFLENKLKNLAKKNKKIKYKKFKYYKNFENFWEKFYKSTKLIKSKYTYLCEDDDFIISENIIKSKNFLDKNKSYICSGGYPYNLEIINNNFFLSRMEFKNTFSFSDNLKVKRIKNIIQNMQSNYNCLHRTKNLNFIFKKIHKVNFKNIIESELLFVLLSAYLGKIKRFDHIEYIKVDNTKHSCSENYSKKNNFFYEIASKSFSLENYSFVNLIKHKLPKKDLIKIEKNIKIFLSKIFEERVRNYFSLNNSSFKNMIKLKIITFLSKIKIKDLVKKVYIKIFYIRTIDNNFYSMQIDSKKISLKNKEFFEKLIKFISKKKL